MITQKMEREMLEQLLAGTSQLADAYNEKMTMAATSEQQDKYYKRLTRYNAVRMLIGDLMLG